MRPTWSPVRLQYEVESIITSCCICSKSAAKLLLKVEIVVEPGVLELAGIDRKLTIRIRQFHDYRNQTPEPRVTERLAAAPADGLEPAAPFERKLAE